MSSHLTLKGVSEIGNALLSDQLETNLYAFLDYALLGAGGFVNIKIPTSGSYGGTFHKLRLVDDPSYVAGRVWEAPRSAWVWESGIQYSSQPIAISGVFVNGNFYQNSTTGTYAFIVDYPRGRVVFNSAIAKTSTVTVEYSYKYYQVYTSDALWWREIQFNSFRVDDTTYAQQGSGIWNTLANNRIQLPAIIVETTPNRTFEGFQIGEGQVVKTVVNFHILTETPWDRKQIVDFISFQNHKTIFSFDKNKLRDNNKYPLSDDGSIASGSLTYHNLVDPKNFFWKKIFFSDMRGYEMPSYPPLYKAMVRGTFDVDMPEI